MIRRQDDNVHDNNDENKDDADDDAGNEMIMMLKIEMTMMMILMLDDGVSSHSRPTEVSNIAYLLQCNHGDTW